MPYTIKMKGGRGEPKYVDRLYKTKQEAINGLRYLISRSSERELKRYKPTIVSVTKKQYDRDMELKFGRMKDSRFG